MEYFQEQNFSMEADPGQEISPTERAFLKKYLGIDDASALQGLAPVEGVSVAGMAFSAVRDAAVRDADAGPAPARTASGGADASTIAAADMAPAEEESVPLDDVLRTQEIVTLVGFYVAGDVFVIPIDAVLEVIRYEEPFKLPMAPAYMPGVVNLRGRILPVIGLSDLLTLESRRNAAPGPKNGLIIICEGKGMQVGLLIDKLHTMFKARQDDINWNAEAHLGPSAELLSGLLETGEKLLGIVSIERLVNKLLEA